MATGSAEVTPKPKAPRWLTEAFRDGIDERGGAFRIGIHVPPAYVGAHPYCWLADHDPARRPCSLPLERFHFIPRQRVENAMWEALREAVIEEPCPRCGGRGLLGGGIIAGDLCPACHGAAHFRAPFLTGEAWDLILLAAWDPRNGGVACEGHHRRYDGHAVSLPRDRIIVPAAALPAHVNEFVDDYGLLADYFGKFKPPYVVDEP